MTTVEFVDLPMKNFTFDRLRILIIDDNAFSRKLIRSMLRQIGPLTVMESQNGTHGLSSITEKRPDVVLLDWFMPKMNGAAVLAAMNKSKAHVVPVIVVTGRPDRSTVIKAAQLGAAGVLAKPFSISSVANKIESVLRAAPVHIGAHRADPIRRAERPSPSPQPVGMEHAPMLNSDDDTAVFL